MTTHTSFACHQCGCLLRSVVMETDTIKKGKIVPCGTKIRALGCDNCKLVDTYDWWREQAIRVRRKNIV